MRGVAAAVGPRGQRARPGPASPSAGGAASSGHGAAPASSSTGSRGALPPGAALPGSTGESRCRVNPLGGGEVCGSPGRGASKEGRDNLRGGWGGGRDRGGNGAGNGGGLRGAAGAPPASPA